MNASIGKTLSAQAFYTQVAEYMNRIDAAWDEELWQAQKAEESEILSAIMGEPNGRTVLDCACGSGGQAIPLAKLGWRVTATDFTEACLVTARCRAKEEGVKVDFRTCDMRCLHHHFRAAFDWVVSCCALDNITDDKDIQQAVQGMFEALRPGGRCYIRLRDLDNIVAVKPRFEFKEERYIPHGRVILLEDWDYESETHLVCTYIFLREDERKPAYRWETDIFSYRRRALRKTELEHFLQMAGFQGIEFLPQPSPWHPYEVVAARGAA